MWQIHDSSRAQLSGKRAQRSGNRAQPFENNIGLQGHWTIEGPDDARRGEHSGDWICCASGGSAGIELGDRSGTLPLTVTNVGEDTLPLAGEQYVCGDAWKIDFPQATGIFSLRLSVRVVQATETRIIWEPTFSLQTSLLDTAPSLALTARGEPDERVSEAAGEFPDNVSIAACRTREGDQMIVLLGPNDAPSTKDRCSRTRLDLRIFGEFLEKGVIRKTRPWIVMDRSGNGVSGADLADYCTQLCHTPLPLTA